MALSLASRIISVAAGVAVLLASSAAGQGVGETVAPLPTPTGRLPVGTAVAYLRDSLRSDPDFPKGRPVTLQLWYPAARAAGRTAPYLIEPALRAALGRFQYYGVDSAALDSWARLRTSSYLDAPSADGRHPLVLLSVGLGVIRANYTSIAEELASHGYIVGLVESPLQGLMVLPDGSPVVDSAGRYGDPAGHRSGVAAWSRDLSFVLDRLLAGDPPRSIAHMAGRIDPSQIGALGHSSGGLVAIAACESDRRIRACVNMDGGVASPDQQPLADFVARGVTKPTLFLRSHPLYDDTTLARRGMTREAWVQRGEAGRQALAALAARSAGPLLNADIAGTGHFSFSDAPFVMPSAITRFGGRIIAADRGWTIVTAALRAYFDRQLGHRGPGLSALAARTPELTIAPPAR